MCMVTREHFITIIFFLRNSRGDKGKGTVGSSCPFCSPFGAAHDTQMSKKGILVVIIFTAIGSSSVNMLQICTDMLNFYNRWLLCAYTLYYCAVIIIIIIIIIIGSIG